MWFVYIGFDFIIVIVGVVLSIILWVVFVNSFWYYFGYVFLIFVLYGLVLILLVYNILFFSVN